MACFSSKTRPQLPCKHISNNRVHTIGSPLLLYICTCELTVLPLELAWFYSASPTAQETQDVPLLTSRPPERGSQALVQFFKKNTLSRAENWSLLVQMSYFVGFCQRKCKTNSMQPEFDTCQHSLFFSKCIKSRFVVKLIHLTEDIRQLDCVSGKQFASV